LYARAASAADDALLLAADALPLLLLFIAADSM
jgi:hypothetical protein